MRILVLGDTGMLGHAVSHRLRCAGMEVAALDRDVFDAGNPDLRIVAATKSDAVVNAIGIINRRLNPSEADFLRINSLFPRRLADLCAKLATPMIHVSTDCVFKGDAGPYDELSLPDASDLYGMTKLWGEPDNAMVIRTSIIGPELRNYYSLMCWFLNQKGQVRGFVNHLWNGVTSYELGGVIATILRQGIWQPGLRHVHGEDMTKFDLLQLIQKIYGTPCTVQPCLDKPARDTRLRTRHPDFLSALAILPMSEQLARLRTLSDNYGHWSAV
ncbi:MAG: sugar nucleotide-binding protein [Sterolibacterium sp.]